MHEFHEKHQVDIERSDEQKLRAYAALVFGVIFLVVAFAGFFQNKTPEEFIIYPFLALGTGIFLLIVGANYYKEATNSLKRLKRMEAEEADSDNKEMENTPVEMENTPVKFKKP